MDLACFYAVLQLERGVLWHKLVRSLWCMMFLIMLSIYAADLEKEAMHVNCHELRN